MEDMTQIEAGTTTAATDADSTSADQQQSQPRDYEAEARAHGWTPQDEFRGDAAKWVDAETFVKRADEVMPFLKKQNAGLKRELDDLKRTVKQSAKFYEGVEERAYIRAKAELEAKHADAVEAGDVAGAKRIVGEMGDLERERAKAPTVSDEPTGNPNQEFAEWVEANDWYILDDKKRQYADLQAGLLGPAGEFKDGPKAWLEELGRRVDKKFALPKPSPVNGGGNRAEAGAGEKSFNNLPAAAKAQCDKFHRNGVFGDPKSVSLADARKRYVSDYDWS